MASIRLALNRWGGRPAGRVAGAGWPYKLDTPTLTQTFTMRTLCPALLAAVLLASCAGPRPAENAVDRVAFVIVRHAEKAREADDPALTDAGRARAERLARSLDGDALVAVYSTDFRRTRQTAAPAAARHGIDVTAYDAKAAPATFADTLRQRHRNGTVLVVGHSNTAPDIAAALCGCPVAPMPETEYGRRMVVTVDATGGATLDVFHAP